MRRRAGPSAPQRRPCSRKGDLMGLSLPPTTPPNLCENRRMIGFRHTDDIERLPHVRLPRRRVSAAAARCPRCESERELRKVLTGAALASVLYCQNCERGVVAYRRQVFGG